MHDAWCVMRDACFALSCSELSKRSCRVRAFRVIIPCCILHGTSWLNAVSASARSSVCARKRVRVRLPCAAVAGADDALHIRWIGRINAFSLFVVLLFRFWRIQFSIALIDCDLFTLKRMFGWLLHELCFDLHVTPATDSASWENMGCSCPWCRCSRFVWIVFVWYCVCWFCWATATRVFVLCMNEWCVHNSSVRPF